MAAPAGINNRFDGIPAWMPLATREKCPRDELSSGKGRIGSDMADLPLAGPI